MEANVDPLSLGPDWMPITPLKHLHWQSFT